jgi:2-amino-4-hydroxy-6-hydroxymethyldihydropteridine diphosphokinase
MNTAYLILGGNKGNKLQNLDSAIQLISEKAGLIVGKSDIFATAAWGNTEQPDFFNQVICLQTALSPQDLLKEIISIELLLGRVRGNKKWAERTMDINIETLLSECSDKLKVTPV